MEFLKYNNSQQQYIKSFFNLKHGEKLKKSSFYDIICTFDTETSTDPDENFAYIILWQFDIDNKVVIYGRDTASFCEFIQFLNDFLKRQLIVYVHNLSYEFQFLKFYFTWDDVFFMSPRKIYKAQTGKIVFKDSYALSGRSLEKTVEKYPVKKAVGTWDYKKIRTPGTFLTDTELKYAMNDVISLYYYIEDMKKQYQKIEKIPMTKTGITRYNCRNYLKDYYNSEPKFKNGYEYYYNNFIKHIAPDKEIYNILIRSYWGGYTHANLFNVNKTLTDVTSFDICSSYPTVMICEKFPYKFYKVPVTDYKKYKNLDDYAIIGKYRLYALESRYCMGYIPIYKIDSWTGNFIKDNGKIFEKSNNEKSFIEIWLNEVDFNIIKDFYKIEKIEIISDYIYISKKHYLPDGYRDFILELYEKKTKLKGVDGKEDEYARAKADLNSLYGMTVTAPVRYKYKLDGREIEKYLDDQPEILLKKAYRQKSKPIGVYQWGVYVAAYARKNLLTIILKISPYDFVYCDTDSIKTIHAEKYKKIILEYNKNVSEKILEAAKNLKHKKIPKTIKGVEKPLGVFEEEYTAKFFKCLRAKTYIATVNGELECTVAGIAKIDIKTYLEKTGDPYKYFNYDLEISADKIKKNTITYIDEKKSEIINGEKITSESSAVIKAIPFTISGDDYYYRILAEVQEYEKQPLHI